MIEAGYLLHYLLRVMLSKDESLHQVRRHCYNSPLVPSAAASDRFCGMLDIIRSDLTIILPVIYQLVLDLAAKKADRNLVINLEVFQPIGSDDNWKGLPQGREVRR